MNSARLLRTTAVALAGVALAAAPPALAENVASTTMAVGLEVVAACRVAAQPLTFGSVEEAQAASLAAAATIDVSCASKVPFTVALDDGQNGTGSARRVFDPATGTYLAYDIYSDAARTQRWGASGAEAVTGVTSAAGTAQLVAYGAISGGDPAPAGSYRDVVTVTASF